MDKLSNFFRIRGQDAKGSRQQATQARPTSAGAQLHLQDTKSGPQGYAPAAKPAADPGTDSTPVTDRSTGTLSTQPLEAWTKVATAIAIAKGDVPIADLIAQASCGEAAEAIAKLKPGQVTELHDFVDASKTKRLIDAQRYLCVVACLLAASKEVPQRLQIAEGLCNFIERVVPNETLFNSELATLKRAALELIGQARSDGEAQFDSVILRACCASRSTVAEKLLQTHFASTDKSTIVALLRALIGTPRTEIGTVQAKKDLMESVLLNAKLMTWLAKPLKLDLADALAVAGPPELFEKLFKQLGAVDLMNSAVREPLAHVLAAFPLGTPDDGPLKALAASIGKLDIAQRVETWAAISTRLSQRDLEAPYLANGLIDDAGVRTLIDEAVTCRESPDTLRSLVQLRQRRVGADLLAKAFTAWSKLTSSQSDRQAVLQEAVMAFFSRCTDFETHKALPFTVRTPMEPLRAAFAAGGNPLHADLLG